MKDAFRCIIGLFNLQPSLLDKLSLVDCGVSYPLTGVVLKCPVEQVLQARKTLAAFCEARPNRTAQDLARPR